MRRGSGGGGRRVRAATAPCAASAFLAPMEAALLSTRREHAPQGLAGGAARRWPDVSG